MAYSKRKPFKPGLRTLLKENLALALILKKMKCWINKLNTINTTMTNTIRFLNNKTIMLTREDKTFILAEIKNPNKVNVWYVINGKYYA